MLREHVRDDLYVILQIRIDADEHVTLHCEESCEQRILMAPVAGELDAADPRVLARESLDQLPRAIAAAIIDEDDPARGADACPPAQALEEIEQALRGHRQHLFLIEARHDDRERRQR